MTAHADILPPLSQRRWRIGFDGVVNSDVSQTTWTQAVQLGAAPSATRLVIAALVTGSASAHTHTSCTVLGTALTARKNGGGAGTNYVTIFGDYIATGNAGNAVSVVSAAVTRWTLAIWSLERASAVPSATYNVSGGPGDIAAVVAAGGIIAAVSRCVATTYPRPNWKGIVPQFRVVRVGANVTQNVSGGLYRSPIAETRALQTDWDIGGSTEQFFAAVWA